LYTLSMLINGRTGDETRPEWREKLAEAEAGQGGRKKRSPRAPLSGGKTGKGSGGTQAAGAGRVMITAARF
jgi:hypothetical protein